MGTDVIITASDSRTFASGNTSKTLACTGYGFTADRDIKIHDLGTFAFLMGDLLGDLKIPNYITDYGRDKRAFRINWTLTENADGDNLAKLEETAWDLEDFFLRTCYQKRYNKL